MDEMFMFRRNALLANICGEWDALWRACGTDKWKLVKLSLMHQSIPFFADYCYRGEGLSKEYIQREFADYINGNCTFDDADDVKGFTSQLYVGFSGVFTASANTTHLMWCDDTTINVEATKCPILFLSNKCDVELGCDGYNNVMVYMFDECRIKFCNFDETCSATVYKYSDRCVVERGLFCLSDKIKEYSKDLKTML